jgi:hypothetical protein
VRNLITTVNVHTYSLRNHICVYIYTHIVLETIYVCTFTVVITTPSDTDRAIYRKQIIGSYRPVIGRATLCDYCFNADRGMQGAPMTFTKRSTESGQTGSYGLA